MTAIEWGAWPDDGDVRHFGSDGGQHHGPRYRRPPGRCGCGCEEAGVAAAGGELGGRSSENNPYDVIRQLNASRHDPLTAREEARAAAAGELGTRDGRDLDLDLRRFRSPDGGNLSGSAAREIVRLTEFRAVQP